MEGISSIWFHSMIENPWSIKDFAEIDSSLMGSQAQTSAKKWKEGIVCVPFSSGKDKKAIASPSNVMRPASHFWAPQLIIYANPLDYFLSSGWIIQWLSMVKYSKYSLVLNFLIGKFYVRIFCMLFVCRLSVQEGEERSITSVTCTNLKYQESMRVELQRAVSNLRENLSPSFLSLGLRIYLKTSSTDVELYLKQMLYDHGDRQTQVWKLLLFLRNRTSQFNFSYINNRNPCD